MSAETDRVLGEQLGQQAWVNEELQEYVAYGLATAACEGALPEHCHTLPVPAAWDPNSALLCLCREKRDDGSTGFRKDNCGLTVLAQKVDTRS